MSSARARPKSGARALNRARTSEADISAVESRSVTETGGRPQQAEPVSDGGTDEADPSPPMALSEMSNLAPPDDPTDASGGSVVEPSAGPHQPPPKRFWRAANAFYVGLCALAGIATLLLFAGFDPFGDKAQVNQPVAGPALAGTGSSSCPPLEPPPPRSDLAIDLFVRDPVSKCWQRELSGVEPGAMLEYLIRYTNGTGGRQDKVVFRVNPPPSMVLVPNSTYFANSSFPHGRQASTNNLVSTGIILGNYEPLANAFVKFAMTVPFASDLGCGWTESRAVAAVNPEGMNQFFNTATVRLYREC